MAQRHRTLLLTAVAATAGLAVAGCGAGTSATRAPARSSTPAPPSQSPSPSPTGSGPFTTPTSAPSPTPAGAPQGTYSVQVSLTGTDTLQGTFSQAVQGSTRCPVPSNLTGTVSGQNLAVQMPAASAATGQPQTLSPGDLQVVVGAHTWGVASASNAPHATSGTLQRYGDGGGSAVFSNLALQSNPSQQPQESGSITWTCT